jgi:hypothetical protein
LAARAKNCSVPTTCTVACSSPFGAVCSPSKQCALGVASSRDAG